MGVLEWFSVQLCVHAMSCPDRLQIWGSSCALPSSSSVRFTSACWKTSIQQSPLPPAAIELRFGVEIFPLASCSNDSLAIGAHLHVLREEIGGRS